MTSQGQFNLMIHFTFTLLINYDTINFIMMNERLAVLNNSFILNEIFYIK